MFFKNKNYFYLFIILITFFLDQVTKKIIISRLDIGEHLTFIPGILRIFLIKNTGGAFSILKDFPNLFLIVGIINIFIFLTLIFSNKFNINNLAKMGCSFVLGGTLGNILDRILYGSVIDFLDFEFISFAVFNMADVFIDIGVILIIISMVKKS